MCVADRPAGPRYCMLYFITSVIMVVLRETNIFCGGTRYKKFENHLSNLSAGLALRPGGLALGGVPDPGHPPLHRQPADPHGGQGADPRLPRDGPLHHAGPLVAPSPLPRGPAVRAQQGLLAAPPGPGAPAGGPAVGGGVLPAVRGPSGGGWRGPVGPPGRGVLGVEGGHGGGRAVVRGPGAAVVLGGVSGGSSLGPLRLPEPVVGGAALRRDALGPGGAARGGRGLPPGQQALPVGVIA